MLVIWTPKRPPRGQCSLIPRSCNTSVCLWLCQPSWAPRMRDLPRSVCSCSPTSLFWTPRIFCRNEGLPVGCTPDGPTKYLQMLGCFYLETFLRSACLEWLCQTPYFQDKHFSKASLSTDPRHHNFSYDIIDDLSNKCAFQDFVVYPRILGIVDLRPL
jgi:hypothetical protein